MSQSLGLISHYQHVVTATALSLLTPSNNNAKNNEFLFTSAELKFSNRHLRRYDGSFKLLRRDRFPYGDF